MHDDSKILPHDATLARRSSSGCQFTKPQRAALFHAITRPTALVLLSARHRLHMYEADLAGGKGLITQYGQGRGREAISQEGDYACQIKVSWNGKDIAVTQTGIVAVSQ